jgi:23S rRNA pseudouridine1911/1915/1917 synthase
MKKFINITDVSQEKRLDLFLKENIDISRSKIKILIDKGNIMVNSKKVKPSYILKVGEVIELNIDDERAITTPKVKVPIIYYDKDIIVTDKPPFLSVHPGSGVGSATLIEAIKTQFEIDKDAGSHDRPGIVHRLDKETSGVMVIARTRPAYTSLIKQFSSHVVRKTYIAIIEGCLPLDEGEFNLPVGRHPAHRQKMTVLPGSERRAITYYTVSERFENATMLMVNPMTGRTHQIRVHFSFFGYPIIGDKVYGHTSKFIDRQALHSHIIEFIHPTTNKKIQFKAPIPHDIKELILALRND